MIRTCMDDFDEAQARMSTDNEDITSPTFQVTIDDGFVSYKYPLNLDKMYSIDMVMRSIYRAFHLPEEKGSPVNE